MEKNVLYTRQIYYEARLIEELIFITQYNRFQLSEDILWEKVSKNTKQLTDIMNKLNKFEAIMRHAIQ
jgi:hypothetical protein